MLRLALAARPAARAFSTRSVARPVAAFRPVAPVFALQHVRFASGGGLDKEQITARILDVMKTFDKVDGGKVSPTAAFHSDLGLDSLDSVEVVMAIEEEFGIEIPDAEADEITSVKDAVDYIAKTPDAH